jgi:hypothetical protein
MQASVGLKLPDSIPDLLLDSDGQYRTNSVTIYQKSNVQSRRGKENKISPHPYGGLFVQKSMRVESFASRSIQPTQQILPIAYLPPNTFLFF